MKNVLKFVLRIVVTVAIIGGIVFGITWIVNPHTDPNKLCSVSAEKDINASMCSLLNGEKSIYNIVDRTSNKNFISTTKVDSSKISDCDNINIVLIDYYHYYINLTCFENKTDSGAKKAIESKINELVGKIKTTQAKLAIAYSANEDAGLEVNERLKYVANAYDSQTQCFIQLDDMLKSYVQNVNYKTNTYNYVVEAQLEMMKEYSKAVFSESLKGKFYDGSVPNALLTDNSQNSFTKVFTKFTTIYDKKTVDVNSYVEIALFDAIRTAKVNYLQEYFKSTAKSTYANDINNFVSTTATDYEKAAGMLQQTAIQNIHPYISL